MDILLFNYFNSFAGRWIFLDKFAVFCAEYLGYVAGAAFVFFLFVNFRKYWPMVITGLIASIFSRFVVTELIRHIWARPRPFIAEKVHLLLPHDSESSFPSGHASFFFALATIVYFYNKKAGYLFFLAAFMISFSRIFIGIHWPSDILAGAVVGILSGAAVILFSRKFFSTAKKQ